MADKKETPSDRYNAKRQRLCEYSITEEDAKTVVPAFKRLVAQHGGKVAAISAAILQADKLLQASEKRKKNRP